MGISVQIGVGAHECKAVAVTVSIGTEFPNRASPFKSE
jgi:hypothetical protein